MDGEKEHALLAELLHSIKGKAILSGYNSAAYQTLYKDWRSTKKTAKAHQGKSRIECLWLSPRVQTTLF